MARIRWHGHTFEARPVRLLDDGRWLMVTGGHGPRFGPGCEIHVEPNEIVSMTAEEQVAVSHAEFEHIMDRTLGLAELEAGMAEERKLLEPVKDIIAREQAAAEARRKAEEDDGTV